jgi:HEAT repeat protein
MDNLNPTHTENTDTIAELIRMLGSPSSPERDRVEEKLVGYGHESLAALAPYLTGDDKGMAWRAARIIAQIPDPLSLDVMRRAITSRYFLVGEIAVGLLLKHAQELQDPTPIVDEFMLVLRQCHPLVQLHIMTAIEKLNDPRVVPDLIKLLAETEAPELRYSVIQVLGLLGDPRAIEPIRVHQNDSNHHVRERALIALKRLGYNQTTTEC